MKYCRVDDMATIDYQRIESVRLLMGVKTIRRYEGILLDAGDVLWVSSAGIFLSRGQDE